MDGWMDQIGWMNKKDQMDGWMDGWIVLFWFTVRGWSGVGLDAFEQRILASGADDTEEEDVEVVEDARVQDRRRHDADGQRQDDA